MNVETKVERGFRPTGYAALAVAALMAPGPLSAGDASGPALVPPVLGVPAGPFIAGSDPVERETAYGLDARAYGHNRTREAGWYDGERDRTTLETGAFSITVTPITNAQYAAFAAATGHPVPDVDAGTWAGYGLIHPYSRTRRHAWSGGHLPLGRDHHPVVLISHADAEAYAAWLSSKTGHDWRLPTEVEWEKAARGPDGCRFPWSDAFDPTRLNSHDQGPFDTVAVGTYPSGASPYGLMDAAGQVFEWTSTPATAGRFVVKGGSWDDKGCGVCRPAARHARPAGLKHILIGFRLVREKAHTNAH